MTLLQNFWRKKGVHKNHRSAIFDQIRWRWRFFFAKFTTHVMIWIFSNTAFISAPSVFIVCWHFSNLSCSSPGTSKYSRAPKIPPSHRRKGQNTKHFMKRRSRTLQWFTSFTKSLVSYATPETSYTVKSKINPYYFTNFN